MHIKVNGKEREVESRCTMAQLLQLLNLNAEKVAVERNRNIVMRSNFDTTVLEENDQVEIVSFVGGG
ncbi:MAG: sulfur carrier protein ThiS [Desulfuromonadaceae bacterium]|nr:sulfur carrier protein ThiS [Desulfuromonadaceae bacterium]